jgi:glutamate N-acetyltransferase / amino-acid N-acetyltransferase
MASEQDWIEIPGGVTAAAAFHAWSTHCGVHPGGSARKPDLTIIFSERAAVGAATFTTNKVKAAPVRVSAVHLRSAQVRAIVLNSGNANACTGLPGIQAAQRMARSAAGALGIKEKQVLVCSTGRIGVPLPVERIEEAIPRMTKRSGRGGSARAARAIMTSDTHPKEMAIRFLLRGKPVTIGGIAKGAGMIDPNMATMLCALTTDASISKLHLQRALSEAVEQSFNRITVDGDMSTNDTVILLANGPADLPAIRPGTGEFERFQAALNHLCRQFARMIVLDGEGVSKFVEVRVTGAANRADARRTADAVANSSLVKCSWHGSDPNWGRILDAVGYSGARVREELVDIFYNGVSAVHGGVASRTPRAKIKEVVSAPKFTVHINLHLGTGEHTIYTTDLTPEYVRFNMGE